MRHLVCLTIASWMAVSSCAAQKSVMTTSVKHKNGLAFVQASYSLGDAVDLDCTNLFRKRLA